MKKIAIFNHKGGVSKTTTTFNVSWMLSKLGNRVLMVDADSQCNLTALSIIGGEGEEEYENFYRQNPNRNIKSALAPAFEGKPRPIEPVDCLQVQGRDSLWLLPGSQEITKYEVSLGVSFNLSDTFGVTINLPGSFNRLIERTAERYGADFAVIDMNPSLSAINQALLLSCDFFIIPTSPDFFSVLALRSLSEILPKWEAWAKNARTVFSTADYPLPLSTPKFLGYTVNNFRIHRGSPTRVAQNMVNTVDSEVRTELIPSLEKAAMLLDAAVYDRENGYRLAQIPSFNNLMITAQKKGKPIFELTAEDTGAVGVVRDNYTEGTLPRFLDLYEKLAQDVINAANYATSNPTV